MAAAEALSAPGNLRRLFVKSYGCQMNVYDARRMADVLAPQGYAEVASEAEADLVILNTCHIREKASEKIFSELGKLRELKQERASIGQPMTVAVAGCVAQAEGAEIFRRQKAVDLVVGPQSYHRLPELLDKARATPGVVDTDFPVDDKFGHLAAPDPRRTRQRGVTSFVTVQEGCDKFCAFCVVPYTRGAEMSRPLNAILDEIRMLTEAGVVEVTLIGQNVNAWHGLGPAGQTLGFGTLIRAVSALPGIVRVRYTTSHPNDMSDDLLEAHRDCAALMPFLHLPVQSGADRILDAMNRKHDGAFYRRMIERVRHARPDIALSSDFIVGFPGETDRDFEDTLQLVRDVGFASAYSFKYSPRPGTPASTLGEQVAEEVKSERLARLQTLLEEQRQAFNRATVGHRVPVLFEKPGRHAGQIGGKTPWLQAFHCDGPADLIGRVADVDVTEAGPNSLRGRLAAAGDAAHARHLQEALG